MRGPAPGGRGRSGVILLAALAVIATASCSKEKKSPPVTTTAVPTTSTTLVPINVPGNPRVTTTISADLQGGTAAIMGTVIGPAGPVDGATVRVERFVGEMVKNADVQSAGGGRWEILGVKGGRYRVRAWRTPDMAQVQPEIFFLQGTEAKNLELRVMQFGGTTAEGSFSPSPAAVGQPSTLTVLVTNATVGPDGIARVTPRPGVSVQLLAGPPLTLQSPAAQVTDGGGRAAWRVQCIQPGPIPMSLNDGTATVSVRVPDCGGPPLPQPTTTTR